MKRRKFAPSIIKPSLAIGCLIALVPTSLSAAATFTTSFDTPGDTEGFSGVNVSSLTVASGLLTGIAVGGDPRLEQATATSSSTPLYTKSPSETWGTVSFRVREINDPGGTATVVTPWSNGGLAIVFNSNNNGLTSADRVIIGSGSQSAVDSGDGFFTVSADMSGYTADVIRYFRFDPIGANDSGNQFEVDFVQLTAVPEPSIALLGALGMFGLVRRRR